MNVHNVACILQLVNIFTCKSGARNKQKRARGLVMVGISSEIFVILRLPPHDPLALLGRLSRCATSDVPGLFVFCPRTFGIYYFVGLRTDVEGTDLRVPIE